jgi:putative Mg2+ transporter-C (MgtC) family protein
MLAEAILGTILVLSANTLLRPVVNRINRAPIDTPDVEVTNTFYVIALKERQAEVLAAVEQVLEQAQYPVREIEVTPFGEREVEVEAVLLATSVDGEELDRLAATLRKLPYVSQAFWSPSVAE